METNQKPRKTMKLLTWGSCDPRGLTTDLGEGRGRNKQKRDPRGVTTDLGGGQGRNKQKRHLRGVTTDLLDV